MLVSLSSVGFDYDGNSIFDGVTFAINEGEKVGLVGENGAGKTTLIKVVLGELSATVGEVVKKSGLKVGYLEQNGGYESDNTVYGEMLYVFKEELTAVERLNEYSARLCSLDYGGKEYAVLSAKIEALNKFIASHDCYGVEVKIKTVLNGMGFSEFYDRRIGTMSGGEKTRLKLARLLLEEPDLLVLDEPTNHLDISTLYWLEGYLAAFKGAVFVVSHDRYFLDKVVTGVVEMENGKLSCYRGNYSKYKILKKERYERALKDYESQREEIDKLQTYVDKNIVRATTAKSAQSRVKQLERMEILEKPFTPPAPPRFNFEYDVLPAETVLRVENLNLEIGGKRLISAGQLQLPRGKKLALVGENGAGKSTFLRAIVSGDNPSISLGRFVKIAYYDQENANLNGENTVLEELWGRHVAYTQTEVRASLARCGLSAEETGKRVRSLSGGQRAKLALCVFENARGNVLVLDEPTNHLDLPARESLEQALKNFDGTVIFVSHDRYFINAVADCVAEIEGGRLSFFEGGYEGYKQKKEEQARALASEEERKKRAEYEEQRESGFRSRKERAAEVKRRAEIKQLEGQIASSEEEESKLNALLSDQSVTSDYVKLQEVLNALQLLKKRQEELYARYGELID